MKNTMNMEWFKAAAIRSLRTMAQTALGMLTIGAAVSEINWLNIASVSFVAGVYSLLTSVATTLPEVGTDGTLQIDKSGEKDIYRLNIDTPLEKLDSKPSVTLNVDAKADLSDSQE